MSEVIIEPIVCETVVNLPPEKSFRFYSKSGFDPVSPPRRSVGSFFGQRPGQRVKADRFAPGVLKLVGEGQSYRKSVSDWV